MTKPRPIPEGYGTVTPWVVTRDTGRVRDPLGNIWWIQERIEEPGPDEMARRLQDPKFTEAMQYVQSSLAPGLEAS
jgi:hypothetical protein